MEEDHARAKKHGFSPQFSGMFCGTCPIKNECWQELQARVRREKPQDAADWDKKVELAKKSGIDPGRIAVALMKAGRPDPWMRDMLENMKTGQESRYLDG